MFQDTWKDFQHLIANGSKRVHDLRLGAGCFRGIFEIMVNTPPCFTGPNRAFLGSRITYCYDQIKILGRKTVNGFGLTLVGDPDLSKNGNRFRVNVTRGFGPRGKSSPIRIAGIDDRFSQLGTAGVA